MVMKTRWASLAAAAIVAGLVIVDAPQVSAQGKPAAKDEIVAKVNGQIIHRSDVSAAARDILPQIANVAPKARYSFIVQYLVERVLLAQEAERNKVQDGKDFKQLLSFYRTKALRDSFVDNKVAGEITEAVMKDAYNKAIKNVSVAPEVRARHILVKTQKEATAIVAQLKKGADFAALAREKSIGPSKARGGDLGYFTKDKMVPEFANAAFKLKKGEISAPVKTNFGWHVIKAEDRRKLEIPPFERMRNLVRSRLLRERIEVLAAKLRKDAKIEYVDKDAAPKKAAPAAAPTPPPPPAPKKK